MAEGPPAGAAPASGQELWTRGLPLVCLGGAWQMAIDAWLLEQDQPALRLYRWQRPCLSLGRHQRRLPPHWLELAAMGAIEIVRRPSGGGAVLHGGDLAYALVWPQPPLNRRQAYRQACRWLQDAFAALGQPLRFGERPATLAAASCFATATAADLVHGDGSKRIGSAQLWRAGRLLQHGSIQLAPDPRLWRQLFASAPPELPPLPGGEGRLEAALMAAAAHWLPLPPLRQQPWSAAELAAIASGLDRARVDQGLLDGGEPAPPAPGVASTSPEASIDRTTWGRASPRG
ncbi:MAG: lipoate--protein ligase family protein [Prochlorococcaceae cyanobacterium]